MARAFETDLHIGIASVLPRQVGDYWKGVADERNSNGGPIFVWYVRTRTGTFVRQCEGDAAQLAKSAIKELLKHDRKKQQSHREQVEGIMEDMLADYEGIQDVADEIAGWANDYVDGIKL